MNPITRALVLFCVLLQSLSVSAQERTRIDSQSLAESRIPIAIPDFVTEPGRETLGQELTSVLKVDLEFTGQVLLVPIEKYPSGFAGFNSDATKINFSSWSSTPAEYLVHVYLSMDGANLAAECRLFDVKNAEQVVGKKLIVDQKWSRRAAHQFSDEIIQHLTGVPGVATSQICFSAGSSGKKEIYVSDYDGYNAKEVTKHNSISILPKFSPDGRKLAYLSYKDRYPFLYILDLESGASKPLSKNVGLNIAPSWAPDGSRLALVLSKDANPEIYLVNADGSGQQRLTKDKAVDSSPAFSPSGQEIAFVSDRTGNPQIHIMGADGANIRRVSFQGGNSTDPEWSPNGKMITYVVEQRGQGLQSWVMNADGSNARQVSLSGSANEAPSWSPDSRYVVFSSNRGGSSLWTANIETGEERPIHGLKAGGQGPSWGPRR